MERDIERLISEIRQGTPGSEPGLIQRAIDHAERVGWIEQETARFAHRCVEIGAFESAAFALRPPRWWMHIHQFLGGWDADLPPAFDVDLMAISGPLNKYTEIKAHGVSVTPALAMTMACIRAHMTAHAQVEAAA